MFSYCNNSMRKTDGLALPRVDHSGEVIVAGPQLRLESGVSLRLADSHRVVFRACGSADLFCDYIHSALERLVESAPIR